MLTAPRLRRQGQAVPRGNLLCEALRDTLTLHQRHQRLRAVHHLGDPSQDGPEVPESRRKLQHSLVAARRFLNNEFRYVVVLTGRAIHTDLDGHRLLKDHDVFHLLRNGHYRGNQRRKLQNHQRRKLQNHPRRKLQDLFPQLLRNHLLRLLRCQRGPLIIGTVCRLINSCW